MSAFALNDAVAILRRTPAVLDTWLRDLPARWIAAREGEGTWSPLEVVGHLAHGEKTDWMARARIILQHGQDRAFDRFDRFAHLQAPGAPSLAALLDEFARLRAGNLAELSALQLSDADLDRRGRHPDLGTVTLRQLLATWVTHDLDHLMQVSRVLATQYSGEVGPWRAYLRIVSGQPG